MKIVLQDLAFDDTPENYEIIENELTDTSRWSNHYRQVFRYEGLFYVTNYSVGATESQDEQPYEYDGDEIECKEVFPVEVMVTKYEPKAA